MKLSPAQEKVLTGMSEGKNFYRLWHSLKTVRHLEKKGMIEYTDEGVVLTELAKSYLSLKTQKL